MKRTWFSSLRTRLVLLVLIGVIPALGVILHTSWLQRKLARDMVQDDALRTARLLAVEQEQLIESTRHFLMALAQAPEVRKPDRAARARFFANLLQEHVNYANIGTIEPDGYVSASGLPLKGTVYLGDRLYFQQALKTRDFSIGDYQVGRLAHKSVLSMGYPILDTRGRISTVLYASIDLTWLSKLAMKTKLPHGSILMALESDGTILLHQPEPELWIGKVLPRSTLLEMIHTEGEGTFEAVCLDGVNRLQAFTPMLAEYARRSKFYVVVGIPSKIAYAEVGRTLERNLIGLGLAAALALTAAWFGGEFFILRRMRALVGATRQLRAGELSARTHLSYGMGELGQLARAFDEMAESLQQRVNERERAERELKRLNEDLETRVEERTRELREKTGQLDADLEMARDLQQAFLPHQHPCFPHEVDGEARQLRFYHRYYPTGRIGGDFFDLLEISRTKAGVFICDVMGQGVRAALVTAIVRGLVEELKPVAEDAGRFLTAINRGLFAIFRHLRSPMFASAFYVVADVASGRMRYANAGHPNPLHLRDGSGVVELLGPRDGLTGPALGLIEDFSYPTNECRIAPGDLVMMFTDGLYEVANANEEEFGPERLREVVSHLGALPPLKLFDELLAEIRKFSVNGEFTDDVCLVGMKLEREAVEARSAECGARK